MVKVPAPKHMITSAKIDALWEPYLILVLMKRPGEPTTCKIFLPGDIGGVAGALISSCESDNKNQF